MSDIKNLNGVETFAAPPAVKKAKYKVKSATGQYELVYLETSADQVQPTEDRVFVTPDEKSKITSTHSEVQTIKGQIGVINGNDSQVGSIAKALKDAKGYTDTKFGEVGGIVDGKVETAKSEINKTISTLSGRVDTNESAISEIREAIAQKGSRTVVVETEEEIATANDNPQVGDMAFVIGSKRAYIYKGLEMYVERSAAPEGWVVFDEITSEVDLVNYLKKDEASSTYLSIETANTTYLKTATANSEFLKKAEASSTYLTTAAAEETYLATATAETTYFKKTDKVQESGLEDGLKNKINGKLDASAVGGKIDEKLNPVKSELNGKIDGLVPTMQAEEPVGKATGHVWLEIAGE